MATSRPRAYLLPLVMLGVVLAGCVGTDGGDRPDDGQADADATSRDTRVILTYNMTATSCTVTELHLPGDADEAGGFLPGGFRSAQHGAAFVLVTHTCPDGAASGPLHASELLVRVEPPVVDDRVHLHAREAMAWTKGAVGCDLGIAHRYYVAGYSDAAFWVQRYTQAGLPTIEAAVTQSTSPVEALGLRVTTGAEGRAEQGGEEVFSFHAATTGAGGLEECVMTWFQSDHGLLVVDEVRRGKAWGQGFAGGVVTCTVAPGTPFAWAVDAARCAQGSVTIGPSIDRTGYAHWFHETFVTPISGA